MTLRLEIISRHRQRMRTRAVKEFGPDGGTIGRSLQTDWPLPDGQRFLSSHHASIDFHSGSYYIVDTSTNGVFINDSTTPVGKGKPQRLFSGDKVRIGEYEMRVEIDTLENTMETLYDREHVDPVEARQKVDSPDPTGHDLVDAFEITGVGLEFMIDEEDVDSLKPLGYSFDTSKLALEDSQARGPQAASAARPGRAQPAAGIAEPTPTPRTAADSSRARTAEKTTRKRSASTASGSAASSPEAASPQSAGNAAKTDEPKPAASASTRSASGPTASGKTRKAADHSAGAPAGAGRSGGNRASNASAGGAVRPARSERNLLEAFCRGAGVDASVVGDEDAREVLFRVGQTFAAMLTGITDALRLRSLQKAELRQAQTVIQQGENNLLKFSANAGEALTRLLAPQTGEYLDPVESVTDAFADLNAHQRAVLKVLPKVLNRYLQQLDPDDLEDRFASAGRNRFIGAANKLRYWDLYRDIYLVMSQQAEDELPEAFTSMMSAAFEEEINNNRAASDAAIIARKVG